MFLWPDTDTYSSTMYTTCFVIQSVIICLIFLMLKNFPFSFHPLLPCKSFLFHFQSKAMGHQRTASRSRWQDTRISPQELLCLCQAFRKANVFEWHEKPTTADRRANIGWCFFPTTDDNFITPLMYRFCHTAVEATEDRRWQNDRTQCLVGFVSTLQHFCHVNRTWSQ